MGTSNLNSLVTWMDVAYAVYENMRSQTGGTWSRSGAWTIVKTEVECYSTNGMFTFMEQTNKMPRQKMILQIRP